MGFVMERIGTENGGIACGSFDGIMVLGRWGIGNMLYAKGGRFGKIPP